LNDHFITIGHKTSQTIPPTSPTPTSPPPPPPPPTPPPSPLPPPFALKQTTIDIVTNILHNLDPNKASDIYDIKPIILKSLTPTLAPILTSLYNESIEQHHYPDALKITKLIILFKSKEHNLPENYRPISLLPIIGKILDKIINDQIMTHCIKHNILSPTQYAFRPNSNTSLALQTILDKLQQHISNKQPTLAIYLDLSKAYDTVSHQKLLFKLQHIFNFDPHTISFLTSYITNRTQTLHTDNATSNPQLITHGIPQGSTLSTTFFILYINDIATTTKHSDIYTYADDTTLIITARTQALLEQYAQNDLTQLISYLHKNNLVPNQTKTTYTTFYPQTHPDIKLTFNNTPLKQEATTKLLGTLIQNTLKFDQNVTNTIKKLQPHIHTFKYINKLLPTITMKQLYYSYIYPHLIYTLTIWGTENKHKTYIQSLHRTHKKIIRLICNTPPQTHTKPLMKLLKILNIFNLYIYRTAIDMHPFIHPPNEEINRPIHNHHYIPVTQIHSYPTRFSQKQSLYIPNTNQYSKTYIPKHTVQHSTAKFSHIWNKLPHHIRNITNIKSFKTALAHHLQTLQDN
jgi:hypothetical protein